MLTQNQEKYLNTIPPDKKVIVSPYSPESKSIALQIISKINSEFPALEVSWIGASALGISGQNDLDLNILSKPEEYGDYLPKLKEIFGVPVKETEKLVKWQWNDKGYEIELYLTDKNSEALQEQIKLFNILKSNPDLLKEYESIKEAAASRTFREYMKAKYEFFNRVMQEYVL